MKRKVRYAGNLTFGLVILSCLIVAAFEVILMQDGVTAEDLAMAVFVTLLAGCALVFMPFGYLFDDQGVSMCFLFFPKERYLWDNIWGIDVEHDRWGFAEFHLYGEPEGKRRFYMSGKIAKSLRTKWLLEKYWDGEIEGYFFEGLRDWLCRKKDKKKGKKKEKPVIRTDEVVTMERAVRGEVRNALAFSTARAAQLGLELRIRYCYTTDDWEESNSRPEGSYSYTVLAELSRPGETDENRIVVCGAYPIRVRKGKKAYRGVKDDSALPELQQELAEVLEEVAKNGLDAYCRE